MLGTDAGRRAGWVWGLLVLVGVLQLVALWSPLRVNPDAHAMLARAMEINGSTAVTGVTSPHPPVAPGIYALMDRVGVATPVGFVLFNAVCVCVGTGMWAGVVRRSWGEMRWWWVWVFTLLGWALVKHFAIPLTELPYLALSGTAIWMMVRGEEGSGWWWVGAAVMAGAATATRSIGVALALPFIWKGVAWGEGLSRRRAAGSDVGRWIYLGTMVLAAGAGCVVAQTRYFKECVERYRENGVVAQGMDAMGRRLEEIAQMAANLPLRGPGRFWYGCVVVLGAVVVARLVICRMRIGGKVTPTDLYLLGYAAVLFFWPYGGDARFWIPVLSPLVAIAIRGEWLAAERSGGLREVRGAILVAVGCFYVMCGVAALLYSARLSVDADHFPDRFGNLQMQVTYREAWRWPRVRADDPRAGLEPDEKMVEVIRHFDRRHALERPVPVEAGH